MAARASEGLILGRYVPTGEGYALAVGVQLTSDLRDAVVSSRLLRGPFLVVAVGVSGDAFFVWTAAVTVVPVGIAISGAAGQRLSVQGDQLMPARPGSAFSGVAPIGTWGPWSPPPELVWAWYVYERPSGALALWVRDHDNDGSVARVGVVASVWGLVEVGLHGGGNPNGHHRSSRAAWRDGGGSRSGVRAPTAPAARRAQ